MSACWLKVKHNLPVRSKFLRGGRMGCDLSCKKQMTKMEYMKLLSHGPGFLWLKKFTLAQWRTVKINGLT